MAEIGRGLTQLGQSVDLVVASRYGNVQPSENLRIVTLGVCREQCLWRHKLLSFLPLVRYFKRSCPKAVIPVFDFFEPVVIVALKLSQVLKLKSFKAKVIFTIRKSTEFLQDLSKFKRIAVERMFSLSLHMADILVAVSHGVAKDWSNHFGVASSRILVIYNPIDVERIQVLSSMPMERQEIIEFLKTKEPIIIAVGRLEPQKDFATLLRAFAKVRQQISCKLLLLGEGSERSKLEKLVDELKLKGAVLMPGFVHNPYPYMAKASTFVLSSRYEGFPNVILEALALGLLVVSTDCPHGPAEILDNGRYGILVPVGDADAMAEAILRTVSEPFDKNTLQERAREFSPSRTALKYLELIEGEGA